MFDVVSDNLNDPRNYLCLTESLEKAFDNKSKQLNSNDPARNESNNHWLYVISINIWINHLLILNHKVDVGVVNIGDIDRQKLIDKLVKQQKFSLFV